MQREARAGIPRAVSVASGRRSGQPGAARGLTPPGPGRGGAAASGSFAYRLSGFRSRSARGPIVCIYANQRGWDRARGWELVVTGSLSAGSAAGSAAVSPTGASFCSQAARRPPPPRAGHDAPRRARPSAPGRPSGSSPRSMPTRAPPHTHGSRGHLQFRPPGPGPPVSLSWRKVPRPSLGRGFITPV